MRKLNSKNIMSGENLDFYVNHAINEIRSQFNASVQIKPKSLLKFGQNTDVDTGGFETLQGEGGNETYATDNDITKVSSSSTSDVQSITIEGHTLGNNELTFVTQTLTLTGQDAADLTTPLYRCTRAFNNSATDFVGDVYVCEDDTITAGVPQTASKIHLKIPVAEGDNQSIKASTSFSKDDYGIITHIYGSVDSKTNGTADIKLQVREYGKTFRTVLKRAIAYGQPLDFQLRPMIIIKPNSDVRLVAKPSADNMSISGGFNALLGIKSSNL